jgi:propanol-preferring alcohol dehydrogenase
VQLLRAVSAARVIAVDVDAAKLELAHEVGAEETVAAGETAAARIRELTRGLGPIAVLDCVGSDVTMALAATVVRPGGAIQAIGLAGGKIPVGYGALPFDVSVTVPYWGSYGELVEVVELARAGKIRAHTEPFPLERAADAYERLRAGTLLGRAVITPHG